ATTRWTDPGNTTFIDWSGGLTSWADGRFIDLEGDQCLVFFLGGIPQGYPNPPGVLGFSNSPTNPALLPTPQSTQRLGPFYAFQPNRLVVRPGRAVFYSYIDAWG